MKQVTNLPKKEWSLLAYVCVDDPLLSEAGKRDIEEMTRGGIVAKTHIAAQIDTQGDFGSLRYEVAEPDFEGNCYRKVIDRIPETYTGNPETLKKFLKWGRGRCVANNRILVLGGHGQGFREAKRDVFWEGDQTGLLIPEIREVMKSLKFSTEIIAFDACYMNLLEIAHQFSGIANIFISSQDSAPTDGWNYEEVAKKMNLLPSASEFSTEIIGHYEKVYSKDNYRTLSAMHIPSLSNVLNALDNCGLALLEKLQEGYKPNIKKIRDRTQRFTRVMAECVDAGDFGVQLANSFGPDFEEIGAELTSTIDNAVIANTRGKKRTRSHGISIWFPDRRFIFTNGRPQYEILSKDCPNWLAFLDEYHSLA